MTAEWQEEILNEFAKKQFGWKTWKEFARNLKENKEEHDEDYTHELNEFQTLAELAITRTMEKVFAILKEDGATGYENDNIHELAIECLKSNLKNGAEGRWVSDESPLPGSPAQTKQRVFRNRRTGSNYYPQTEQHIKDLEQRCKDDPKNWFEPAEKEIEKISFNKQMNIVGEI